MRKATTLLTIGAAALLAGCATRPVGPMVRVIPAPYKPFEVFERDQYDCERYADSQIAGGAEAANNRAVGAAALGTALGLAVGAATGDGHAATFGAVSGGAIGTAIGADQSQRAGYSLQRQYDIAYTQCMYAKGNQVPGYQQSGTPPPPPPQGYDNGPPRPPPRPPRSS
jgi:hypothetical protein